MYATKFTYFKKWSELNETVDVLVSLIISLQITESCYDAFILATDNKCSQ